MTQRLDAAITLRDAALTILQKNGEQSNDRLTFERHTPQNPTPRLSLASAKLPNQVQMLSVWAMIKGKHVKALNLHWIGEQINLGTFRRGEWESELLEMARSSEVAN